MEHALQARPGYRKLNHPDLTQPRPRLDPSKPRVGAGIVLADVSDEQIVALLDAGLSRSELAAHYGVGDHVIRYRDKILRESGLMPAKARPSGRFFIDDIVDGHGDRIFYQIAAHRRAAWDALVAMESQERPRLPSWAVELVDFSLLEFSKPLSFGAYLTGAHAE
ncbi:hypothetical protein [Devosia salina]|uniref:Uncharacterized protein n=1 Tax=Devosia salina TaxID=2860336 RepID=A0ABX8WF69_9HYPH|nr:hypothetical protein [Devosia salina]QYO75621.1 hypothetical protein K1X15_13375 [Devosia salina]